MSSGRKTGGNVVVLFPRRHKRRHTKSNVATPELARLADALIRAASPTGVTVVDIRFEKSGDALIVIQNGRKAQFCIVPAEHVARVRDDRSDDAG